MKLFYTINQPPAIVAHFLTDMEQFVAVHPVITKMKPTGATTFLVYERLKTRLCSCSFTYPATVTANSDNTIITMQARVMKLATIQMRFTITKSNNGSSIQEEIHFRSWLPIKNIMQQIFKKQHALLFQNIEKHTH